MYVRDSPRVGEEGGVVLAMTILGEGAGGRGGMKDRDSRTKLFT